MVGSDPSERQSDPHPTSVRTLVSGPTELVFTITLCLAAHLHKVAMLDPELPYNCIYIASSPPNLYLTSGTDGQCCNCVGSSSRSLEELLIVSMPR